MKKLVVLVFCFCCCCLDSYSNAIPIGNDTDIEDVKADVPYVPYYLHNYSSIYDEEQVRNLFKGVHSGQLFQFCALIECLDWG